jgi:hypothetical protein
MQEVNAGIKAMSAFCRQRSKMEGEDEQFWLTEAELLAKLAVNAKELKQPGSDGGLAA